MLVRALFVISLCSFFCSANADNMKALADVWSPYTSESGSKPGYLVEIVKAALKMAGHEVTYESITYARALDLVKNNDAQILIGVYPEEAEKNDLYFDKEGVLGMSAIRFFSKRGDKWRYAGVDSVGTRTVGLIKGYEYGEISAAVEKKKVKAEWATGEDSLTQNVRKLAAGRVDLILDDGLVVKETAVRAGLWDSLQDAGPLGAAVEVHAVFPPLKANPNSKAYAKALIDGVQKLRGSGELAKILSKYGITDWKK